VVNVHTGNKAVAGPHATVQWPVFSCVCLPHARLCFLAGWYGSHGSDPGFLVRVPFLPSSSLYIMVEPFLKGRNMLIN